MEGAISLGIYDHTGKLVRVLHRAATGEEFVAALDGYITHWDGLDDNSKPLPPGHYHVKGYMVGDITIREMALPAPGTSGSNPAPDQPTWLDLEVERTGTSGSNPAPVQSLVDGTVALSSLPIFKSGDKSVDGTAVTPPAEIRVGLVPNPLDRDRAGSAELSVGLDSNKNAWLQLADGLPLKQITSTQNVSLTVIGRSPKGDGLIVFLTMSDGSPEAFVITKVANMMAFDCGEIDLPVPSN